MCLTCMTLGFIQNQIKVIVVLRILRLEQIKLCQLHNDTFVNLRIQFIYFGLQTTPCKQTYAKAITDALTYIYLLSTKERKRPIFKAIIKLSDHQILFHSIVEEYETSTRNLSFHEKNSNITHIATASQKLFKIKYLKIQEKNIIS